MKVENNKNLYIIPSILIFILTITVIIFSYLGSKERVGYIEVMDTNVEDNLDNTYQVRMRYYNKVFRNSDIYGVYIKTESLPQYIKDLKFGYNGSPFGSLYSDKKLEIGEEMDNIVYTLKVKAVIYFILFYIIFIWFIFVFKDKLNSFLNSEKKLTLAIIFISILGFIFTNIIFYPYDIHWDSNYVFETFVLNNKNPDNWMGWFYPYLWKIIYSVFPIENVISILHNLLYWISLTVIYMCMFEKRKPVFYILFYIIYAFILAGMIMIGFITNNILMTTFIMFAISFYLLFEKYRNKIFMILSFLIGYTLTNKKLFAVLSIFIMLFSFVIINKVITNKIPNYNSGIKSIGLIAIFDMVGMSSLKNELIIPDKFLREEYRAENRYKVMNSILENKKYVYDDVLMFQKYKLNRFLSSGYSSSVSISLPDIFSIYTKNIWYYILFRFNLIIHYIWFFFTIVACVLIYLKSKFNFNKKIKRLCITMFMSGVLYFVVLMISVVSRQTRYLSPNCFLVFTPIMFMIYNIFIAKKYRNKNV